jgi:hypothetical protein
VFRAATDVDVAQVAIINELAHLLLRHLQTSGDILEREQSVGGSVAFGRRQGSTVLRRLLQPSLQLPPVVYVDRSRFWNVGQNAGQAMGERGHVISATLRHFLSLYSTKPFFSQ